MMGLVMLLGAASGAILGVAASAAGQADIGQAAQGAYGPGSELPVVIFLGAPAVLAAGWAMLALWYAGNRRWLAGGAVAAVFALLIAAAQMYSPNFGFGPQVAWALVGGESFVAGVWLADLFYGLNRKGVTIGLAADIWMLLLFLPWFAERTQFLFPLIPAALLIAPTTAISIALLVEKGRPQIRRSLQWLTVWFLALPAGLLGALQIARAMSAW
jgi:hypothetical protein